MEPGHTTHSLPSGSFVQDLKFGARLLRKNPGFTLIAVLTLALGIGANTAVFSVVDTVLLRPLPYLDPSRLVLVSETVPKLGIDDVGVSAGEYIDYRDRNRAFSSVAAYEQDGFNLTGSGTPLRIHAALVTSSLFPLLGVSPELGRTFNKAENQIGADHVVVLSHDLWQREYGSDPGILGKAIKLDEKSYTVLGVMPASFRFPSDAAPVSERADLWVPLTFPPDLIQDRLREFGVWLIGQLKPGVSPEQAQQDVQRVANDFMRQYAKDYSGNLLVAPHAYVYSAHTVEKTRPLLLLLLGAVGCVLLIACANVASLLLAHAGHRSREMAIRSAVGAARARLLRQCLVESGLLSLLGAAAGILLAFGLIAVLRHFGPETLPRLQDVRVHSLTLWFTLALSLATTMLFGFMPAWRLSQASPESCMKESTQAGPATGAGSLQTRLAVAEVAIALVLAIASSLVVRSFVRVLNAPFGFNPEGAVVVRTLFDRARYPDPARRAAAQKELLAKLAQLPGVKEVAGASHLPLSDSRQIGFLLEHAAPDDYHWAQNSLISAGYFRTMGIPIVRGRDFTEQDRPDTPPVAIVSQTFVRQFFPHQDAIGQRFYWGDRAIFTIVGVAGDVRISSLDSDPPPMIYDSMFQVQSGASARMAFVIRLAHANAESEQGIFNAVRQQIWSVDKDLPAYDNTTLAALVSESVAQRRFTTLLMGAFAGVALLLAAIGLFGVISYLVSERTRELAVRVALGADARQIGWLVLRRGFILGLVGCGIGLAVFAAISQWLRSSLYGVSRFDPLTLTVAPALLLGITLAAAYWPARRAMKADPMLALRHQ